MIRQGLNKIRAFVRTIAGGLFELARWPVKRLLRRELMRLVAADSELAAMVAHVRDELHRETGPLRHRQDMLEARYWDHIALAWRLSAVEDHLDVLLSRPDAEPRLGSAGETPVPLRTGLNPSRIERAA